LRSSPRRFPISGRALSNGRAFWNGPRRCRKAWAENCLHNRSEFSNRARQVLHTRDMFVQVSSAPTQKPTSHNNSPGRFRPFIAFIQEIFPSAQLNDPNRALSCYPPNPHLSKSAIAFIDAPSFFISHPSHIFTIEPSAESAPHPELLRSLSTFRPEIARLPTFRPEIDLVQTFRPRLLLYERFARGLLGRQRSERSSVTYCSYVTFDWKPIIVVFASE
jgi:hypothetical protein